MSSFVSHLDVYDIALDRAEFAPLCMDDQLWNHALRVLRLWHCVQDAFGKWQTGWVSHYG